MGLLVAFAQNDGRKEQSQCRNLLHAFLRLHATTSNNVYFFVINLPYHCTPTTNPMAQLRFYSMQFNNERPVVRHKQKHVFSERVIETFFVYFRYVKQFACFYMYVSTCECQKEHIETLPLILSQRAKASANGSHSKLLFLWSISWLH